MTYDVGRLRGGARQGDVARDYKGFGARKAAIEPPRASCAASASRLHRGLRHRAVAAPSARWAPASACWESAEMRVNPIGTVEVLTGSHSHGQGHETTFAQVVAVASRHPDRERLDRPRRHRTRSSSAWAPTARARSRSAGGDLQGARQGRGQGEEDRRPSARGLGGRHRVQGTASSRSRAPTSRSHCGSVALDRLHRAQVRRSTEIEPGLKESAFYDPTNFTFPPGVHICEVEVDPADRQVVTIDRFDRGRRLRQHHQSDDRRRPGAWRHRAGHRPGACSKAPIYDDDGPAADGEFMDYAMPRADDVPSFTVDIDRRRPAPPTRSASRAAAKRARSARRRR